MEIQTQTTDKRQISHSPSEKRKAKLNYGILIGLAAIHLIALLGFFTFSWPAFFLFFFLSWLTGGIGITLGYHRLLTHRSFTCPKWVEYVVAFIGSMALQGGPINWIGTHRLHHNYSDQWDDPHSPRHGFWWSHMIWLVYRQPLIDRPDFADRYTPDLAKDPFYTWLNKYDWIVGTFGLGALFYWWGGLSFVVWGIFVRAVWVYHTTWLVNSATHMWGYQTYKLNDDSRNLWWVALFSFGEGWHNNHHAFQTSARHGLQWWEFDVTYLTIQILSFLGLAANIKIPADIHLEAKKI